MVQKRL